MTARSRLVRRLQHHARIGTLVGPPPPPDAPEITPAPVHPPVIAPFQGSPLSPKPGAAPAGLRPVDPDPPEDPTWDKLKAISRLHREKQAREGGKESTVGQKPDLHVLTKSPDANLQRRTAPEARIQRETEEDPPIVEVPEAPPEPPAPPTPPGGTPDANARPDPDEATRQTPAPLNELQGGIELPKPDHPEDEVIQRMLSSSGMGGTDTGFPSPFITPFGPTGPGPSFPGVGRGPLPAPYPAFPVYPPEPSGAGKAGGTEITGDAPITGDVQSEGGIEVGGSATTIGNITAGGSLSAGGAISGHNLSAGAEISAGGAIEAISNVNAGTSVDAGGEISAGLNLTAGNGVSSGADTSAGTDMTVEGAVSAGGNVSTGGDFSPVGAVEAGANVSGGGDISAAGNLTAGGNVIGVGGIDVTGNVQSGAAVMGMGDVDIGGTATVGGAVVSAGDTKFEGAANAGSVVMASGDMNFSAGPTVGGAVIVKGDTQINSALTTSILKGADVEVGGSLATTTLKASTLSAGGSVTIGGRADVGTINASSVSIYGPTSAGGGGSVAMKPAGGAPQPGRPLNEAWPVQRRPEADPRPDFPTAVETDSKVEYLAPSRPRPVPGPAARPTAPAQAGPEAPVHTDIGDLPADLWQLLGRETPAVPPQASRPDVAVRPMLPETDQRTPEVIQRAAADTPAASDEGEAEVDPDIDALARKVYAQLKRRLNVEMERNRRGR